MSIRKIGLYFVSIWCAATGMGWLLSGHIDFADNLIIALAGTLGAIVGDLYRQRERVVDRSGH